LLALGHGSSTEKGLKVQRFKGLKVGKSILEL
jgi:hypothetical protein